MRSSAGERGTPLSACAPLLASTMELLCNRAMANSAFSSLPSWVRVRVRVRVRIRVRVRVRVRVRIKVRVRAKVRAGHLGRRCQEDLGDVNSQRSRREYLAHRRWRVELELEAVGENEHSGRWRAGRRVGRRKAADREASLVVGGFELRNLRIKIRVLVRARIGVKIRERASARARPRARTGV